MRRLSKVYFSAPQVILPRVPCSFSPHCTSLKIQFLVMVRVMVVVMVVIVIVKIRHFLKFLHNNLPLDVDLLHNHLLHMMGFLGNILIQE